MGRIALIGSNGQLGSDIARLWNTSELGASGEELVGLTHADIDVTDLDLVRSVLGGIQPSLVVNTAAFHRVDDCEQQAEMAFLVNGIGTKNLAEVCLDIGATLAHFSTDYVFDGEASTPYDEDDPARPISAYGISKLAGEHFLRYMMPEQHIIVRSSGLYGVAGASGKGGNFIETMLRFQREGQAIQVVNDQVSTPTYTVDLADAFLQVLAKRGRGTYHITSAGSCTWYDVACELFSLLDMNADLTPTTAVERAAPALRPNYSLLSNRRLNELGIPQPRHWREALSDYLRLKGRLAA
ncbi:MAG TPA: dTDP-4-dehydrorhamnose reductase [Dehalococcoidia bacterium]|nr:dTDP-4-dehydrorhamnose reductase [Dehalococcoidia bacterium]